MKKLLIISNLVWMAVFVMAFKNPFNNKPTAPPNAYHLVDIDLATKMIKNYKTNYANGIRTREGRIDARTVWFSLEKIESFVADLKAQSRMNNLPAPSGIRFYYCQYPKLNEWSQYPHLTAYVNDKYNRVHTLLMVPTYFDGTFDLDYDPRFKATTGSGPMPIAEVMQNIEKAKNTDQNPNARNINALVAFGTTSSPDLENPNLTNGGSAIPPPPYNGTISNSSNVSYSIGIPCTGARLMDYIDGVTCGSSTVTPVQRNQQRNR